MFTTNSAKKHSNQILRSILLSTLFFFSVNICQATLPDIKTECIADQSEDLEITINNHEDIVRIVIANTKKGSGSIEIKNADGVIVYTESIQLWDGSSVIDLEQEDFGKGTFIVQVTTDRSQLKGSFELN